MLKDATQIVHWPGKDSPACDEHASKLSPRLFVSRFPGIYLRESWSAKPWYGRRADSAHSHSLHPPIRPQHQVERIPRCSHLGSIVLQGPRLLSEMAPACE